MTTDKAEEKFLSAIRRYSMITGGAGVVCAISGGADSVALLSLMRTYREALGLSYLSACHVNHCLRGEESDRDQAFVEELCLLWDMPLHVHKQDALKYTKAHGYSLEEGARQMRYAALEAVRPKGGLIATAHTLSDSIETFIINQTRGTGIDGLAGIPPVRDGIIRPLIECTRGDIEGYLSKLGISFVTDSTNLEDIYTRNRVRNRVLPELKAISRGYEAAIARTMTLLREDAALLDSMAKKALASCRRAGGGYDISLMLNGDIPLPRVLRAMLGCAGVRAEYKHIELCAAAVVSGSGSVMLGDGHLFYVHMGVAYLIDSDNTGVPAKDSIVIPKDTLFAHPLTIAAGNGKLKVTLNKFEHTVTGCKFSNRVLKNSVDYDRIGSTVEFRPHMPGDRLTQPGRKVTKQLKKLISEARVAPHERPGVYVAVSGGNIIWADGFGHDQSAAPDERTRLVIHFEKL